MDHMATCFHRSGGFGHAKHPLGDNPDHGGDAARKKGCARVSSELCYFTVCPISTFALGTHAGGSSAAASRREEVERLDLLSLG